MTNETSQDAKLLAQRRQMVEQQLRGRGIASEQVLQAFMDVPRDRFVPSTSQRQAYDDTPLPIGYGQTISQPYVVALMVQELCPQPSHRVLDVGAGSGYQTAILATLVRHVYAIERFEPLTERGMAALADLNVSNVTFYTGDGSIGLASEAPFDGIICGAGAPDVPPSWIDQLANGGRIVMPVGNADVQMLITLHKDGPRITRRDVCPVRFVKLIGREGWTEAPL